MNTELNENELFTHTSTSQNTVHDGKSLQPLDRSLLNEDDLVNLISSEATLVLNLWCETATASLSRHSVDNPQTSIVCLISPTHISKLVLIQVINIQVREFVLL